MSPRTAANVVLAGTGVAAAFLVLRTPSLRRLALRAARVWLAGGLPIFVLNEVRKAWAETGRPASI
jgi:hypothetical protein